ncbi:MAG TPA: hypothetical protein VK169_20970 [Saprospiraceae bacterium]|nr:hypothetical protein [Saprospiraceae bacterium]
MKELPMGCLGVISPQIKKLQIACLGTIPSEDVGITDRMTWSHTIRRCGNYR